MTTDAAPPQAPEHGYEPGTARAALSYRSFRIIFIGLALSNIGTWMQNFTLPAYGDDRTGRAVNTLAAEGRLPKPDVEV